MPVWQQLLEQDRGVQRQPYPGPAARSQREGHRGIYRPICLSEGIQWQHQKKVMKGVPCGLNQRSTEVEWKENEYMTPHDV